jgi:maleylacetoacetate isomerase/maleylpyruvate isomerase
MQLFSYFRSSAAWRVRIALALKGLDFDYRAVHLLKNEHIGEGYARLQPSRLVPSLVLDDDAVLSQSLAIIEYLDETHPEPPLLPPDALGRAQVRALAQDIACDIHPLCNLRVLRYLVHEMGVSEDQKNRWIRHWIEAGLVVMEQRLQDSAGQFCFGDRPGLADCVLVPQVFNAQRFECRTDHLPTLMRIAAHALSLPAFANTQPSQCPDAE